MIHVSFVVASCVTRLCCQGLRIALTCVYVRVLLHVGLLVEPLPAVLARVRPRVRVDQEVRGEGGAALETLAALITLRTRCYM